MLCTGTCPLYFILANGDEIVLGSCYSEVFPFGGWIPSQQVAAATSKGEFDIAANHATEPALNLFVWIIY